MLHSPISTLIQNSGEASAALQAADQSARSGNAIDLVQRLLDWLIAFAPQLVGALLTLIVGFWSAKLLSRGAKSLFHRSKLEQTLAQFLSSLVYYALIALVFVAVLGKLGVETASFVAILGAAGLAVGFALQGSLSNLASGVMIMLFRPFRAGDVIQAGGQEGLVEEIQVFATILKTIDNRKVILPNSAVTGGSIVNYTANGTRRVDMTFTVAATEDPARVKAIVAKALATIPLVLKDPAPEIDLVDIGAGNRLSVRPWCKSGDYGVVLAATQEAVKAAFTRESVKPPVPLQLVQMVT